MTLISSENIRISCVNTKILNEEFVMVKTYDIAAKAGQIDNLLRCNIKDVDVIGELGTITITNEDITVIVRRQVSEVQEDIGSNIECNFEVRKYTRRPISTDGEIISSWVDPDEYNDIHFGKD